MRGVIYPHMRVLPLLVTGFLFGGIAQSEEREGRLTSGCAESQRFTASQAQSRHCHWIVRYEREGSADQKAIEAVLGDLTPVQPPQLDGDKSSVLAKRKSGQFVVVYLQKRDGVWQTTSHLKGLGKKTKIETR